MIMYFYTNVDHERIWFNFSHDNLLIMQIFENEYYIGSEKLSFIGIKNTDIFYYLKKILAFNIFLEKENIVIIFKTSDEIHNEREINLLEHFFFFD